MPPKFTVLQLIELLSGVTLSESALKRVVDEEKSTINMNVLLDEIISAYRSVGREKGRETQQLESVLRMHNREFTNEQIADILELTPTQVEECLTQYEL